MSDYIEKPSQLREEGSESAERQRRKDIDMIFRHVISSTDLLDLLYANGSKLILYQGGTWDIPYKDKSGVVQMLEIQTRISLSGEGIETSLVDKNGGNHSHPVTYKLQTVKPDEDVPKEYKSVVRQEILK